MRTEITLPSKKVAEDVARLVAGELGARYDAITGRWSYIRDGQTRYLFIDKEPVLTGPFKLVLEVADDAN